MYFLEIQNIRTKIKSITQLINQSSPANQLLRQLQVEDDNISNNYIYSIKNDLNKME